MQLHNTESYDDTGSFLRGEWELLSVIEEVKHASRTISNFGVSGEIHAGSARDASPR